MKEEEVKPKSIEERIEYNQKLIYKKLGRVSNIMTFFLVIFIITFIINLAQVIKQS